MKDLTMSYDTGNGLRNHVEYDTIMDFTDAKDSGEFIIPELESHNVEADFFENPLLHKHFNTIQDLYDYCVMML